jgi:hypothetical protein
MKLGLRTVHLIGTIRFLCLWSTYSANFIQEVSLAGCRATSATDSTFGASTEGMTAIDSKRTLRLYHARIRRLPAHVRSRIIQG